MMEDFLNYFLFNELEWILLSVLFVILLIQVLYYLIFYRKPVSYYNKVVAKNDIPLVTVMPSVSVIVIAKNESENLQNNLPSILEQDYSNFEVIVVNDGSTDESEAFLNEMSHSYANLYHTFSPDFRDRKISLTIAIKAAKNDVLLFIDAGCKPMSDKWISAMMQNLTNDKDIVLGYGCFGGQTRYRNLLENFDNLIFSLQYFSKAILKNPYTGTYRNIAFRKKLFFENKGFSKVLNFESCEKVFVNRVMNKENTAVALQSEAYVLMDDCSYWAWKELKIAYMRAKSNFEYRGFIPFWLETATRYIFVLLFLVSVVYGIISQQWIFLALVALFYLLRNITQLLVLRKSSKLFGIPVYGWSLPVFEIIQPLYNGYFRFLSRKKRL